MVFGVRRGGGAVCVWFEHGYLVLSFDCRPRKIGLWFEYGPRTVQGGKHDVCRGIVCLVEEEEEDALDTSCFPTRQAHLVARPSSPINLETFTLKAPT